MKQKSHAVIFCLVLPALGGGTRCGRLGDEAPRSCRADAPR